MKTLIENVGRGILARNSGSVFVAKILLPRLGIIWEKECRQAPIIGLPTFSCRDSIPRADTTLFEF